MSRGIWFVNVLGVMLLPWLTGCMSVAKQAFYELRGAKAEVVLNGHAADLQPYASVEFTPVTTTLSDRLCPRDVIAAYDRYLRALPRELEVAYPGGEPRLTLDSEVMYFQSKGIMSQAQMLTRVRMRTGDHLLVDAIVKCESKAFREGGGDDLAETSVKALGKWLRKQKGLDDDRDRKKRRE